MTASDGARVRLQKVLAAAGVASRRASERLIAEGRVQVNGSVVARLGAQVDPETDVVHVDGTRVVVHADASYLALNKPAGVHTTMTDPRGRRCIGDLLAERGERLFHVGRLDADTEGLLLLTNDGELTHRLTHPSYQVRKTYLAEVSGVVTRSVASRAAEGIELEDGPLYPERFAVVDTVAERSLVEVVVHEGRNRVVRRLLAELGHPVRRLVRTCFAGVTLAGAAPEELRELSREEVGALYRAVEL